MPGEPLTQASERLLRDFDKTPDAIDHSELAARLWLIEREAALPPVAPDGADLDVETLAHAIWDTSEAAEERPFVDATEDQRATGLDWAREIAAEYRRLRAGEGGKG